MNKSIKPLVCVLVVSDLMFATRKLTQNYRYPASLLTTLWHRLIVLHIVTRFQKSVNIQCV